MKTRAAVLYEMGLPAPYKESKPLVIEQLDLELPGMGEVLVRIRAAGLCHSDLSVKNGNHPRPTPMVLGHEAAGEVIEIGESVYDLAVGDHMVCAFVSSCGHCALCREGRPALCEPGAEANSKGVLLSGERRLKKEDTTIYHHLGVSRFSDYAVIDQHSLIKVDPSVPFHEVTIFGCAVMTGVGAVLNTAQVKAGSSVAIVGLSALLGTVVAGARQIVAVDINPNKLELAKSLGATDIFNAKDPQVVNQIRSNTGDGVEYAFETAGVVPAMQTAYQITRRGGTTIASGLPHPKEQLSIPQVTLAAEERTIKGSYIGSCVPTRDIPRYIELYRQGRLPVDRLLTDTLPLKDINEGFDRLARGQAARLVVTL
ncbi:zinc-dependent alcohol dehydrogenase family protein [Thermoactinomyces mirandus]|uniref:Alcohol dehydrogenase catalytic domain-containing protein n=1 Tax=Thermoactinomyces mirandus TaxID=2756294 RepID=A0A7W2AQH2_9BACL|nr:zinc-dependent alcohol dehydrogenase family protein [Thermoactinomyces mirandus]MBA4601508.1 alcohol dehydrogenase catalytic domain-containing protein [Thermoactinomyces mirandus]